MTCHAHAVARLGGLGRIHRGAVDRRLLMDVLVNAKARRSRHRRAMNGTDSARSPIDRDDNALLTFAVSWLPYGGGPEDEILVTFGLSHQRYLGRVREAVERNRHLIHPDTVGRLLQMCDELRPDRRNAETIMPTAPHDDP